MDQDLQPGARVTLTIDTLAFGGEGIGRVDGRAVFVPFTAPGDVAEAAVREVKKNFARAELVRVFAPGPGRAAAPCPYYGACGGCQYQHLAPEAEVAVKEAQVGDALRRLGKIADARVLPLVSSPQAYGYRNRITVHAAGGKVGFHRARGGSRELVDVAHCLLAVPEVNAALADLRRASKKPREGHFSLRAPGLPPSAFHQVNGFLLEPLRDLVVEWTGAGAALVEGYCGGGFFTGPLAARFAAVWAIESDARALRDARRLPAPHVRWIEGRVEDRLCGALAEAGEGAVVLVDPPREGLAPGAVAALRERPPARIVYVSCDPATLARDVASLCAGEAFVLERVQPFDMFPRTAQIETVSALRRKG